jgi:hydroxymethylpyrimidine/phosphomethylpyrimidine kinase
VVITGGGFVTGDEADGRAVDRRIGAVPARAATAAPQHVRLGGTFAAAIAGRMALGDDPPDAVTRAKSFVSRAVTDASDWQIGAGRGPIDHFGWSAL